MCRRKGKDQCETYSITQINLKRKYNAWGTLLANIHGRKNPIILASEPYTNNKHQLQNINKDLNSYYCKNGVTRPRAAIVVHKSLEPKCWELQNFTTPDQVAIKIRIDSKELILASSYMDINGPVPPPETTPLAKFALDNKLPLIMGSETNSHHTLWGNRLCNERGEELLEFLSSLGLSWANKGATPTFLNTRGHNSIIDLTITNQTGGDLISNWHVSNLYSNSDHRYIMFDITVGPKQEPKIIRLTKNTDWDNFNHILSNSPLNNHNHDMNNTSKIDETGELINSTLKQAFEEACPPTYISSSIRKPPWLTPEVEEAQRGIKRKLMAARNTKTDAAWEALREGNKFYNKLLSKSQQHAWRSFCQDTESVKESARMNKILKPTTDSKTKLESVYKQNGQLTNTATETLEVMAQTHFKDCSDDSQATPCIATLPSINLMATIYKPERLKEAVKSFDPLKAAGPDSLKPIIIQKAWEHIKDITTNIMIRSHELLHIPAPWRESTGIFIPKPGKTDYNHPKSYRTITLSPVMLKLQEKVILWHMQHDLNIATDLNKRQYGFRKGCSTEAALHKVVNKIERRIARKGFVLGVFLDIEGAFDNVSFKAIAESIKATKVDTSTANWIIKMVTNRYITIKHKNTNKRIRIKRGCPQGGILSPFLWNLVIDDLLNYTAKDIPGYLQAFADDLASLAEGNDTDVIWERTCRTIDTIEKWCHTKGLTISTLKTKIVMFTWNRKWSLRPIKVGDTPIELSPSAKFLGVTLDSKLNFNEHIDKITKKATSSLMQCRRAVGPTWGLTPKTCKWMYKTVIRPILSYCVSIWIRATQYKTNATKFERVQALALRIMTGAMPSTPFNALNYITDTTNIIPYLKGEAAKGASRLQAYGDWSRETVPRIKGTIYAHTTINNDFLADLNIPKSTPRDLIKPFMTLNRKFRANTPEDNINEYRQSLVENINSIPDDTITCYTDGSRMETGCGAGYIITTNNNETTINETSLKLPDYCTVYQAELTAITEACKLLNSVNNKHIIIWTDSLSSIKTLTSHLIRSKTAKDCFESINQIATNNDVEIRWIAAHSGLWGNEKADELAKIGTTNEATLVCPVPQSYIKNLIDHKVNLLDTNIWQTNGHRHTNMTIGNKNKTIKKHINTNLINNRTNYRTAMYLVTGHCSLNKHLYTIHRSNTKLCPKCESAEETVAHFLGECPATALIRGNIFHNHYLSINDIFDNYSMSTIIKYTKHTNRFNDPEHLDQSGVT